MQWKVLYPRFKKELKPSNVQHRSSYRLASWLRKYGGRHLRAMC